MKDLSIYYYMDEYVRRYALDPPLGNGRECATVAGEGGGPGPCLCDRGRGASPACVTSPVFGEPQGLYPQVLAGAHLGSEGIYCQCAV